MLSNTGSVASRSRLGLRNGGILTSFYISDAAKSD